MLYRKIKFDEMVQCVKPAGTKPEDLSPVLGVLMVSGEDQLLQVSSDLHISTVVHKPTHLHTHAHTHKKQF